MIATHLTSLYTVYFPGKQDSSMHASSVENMEKCVGRFVAGDVAMNSGELCVVEIGAADVNGSYRPLFKPFATRYVGVDLSPGPGVDLVLNDPYDLPLPDASAHVVLSGQMLEHCEFFWRAFEEMHRILHPDGYLFLIAPSGGPEHRYPVDCYRFYPDSFRALAKLTRCRLVDLWLDERGPWCDLVGVFAKHDRPAPIQTRRLSAHVAPTDLPAAAAEEETTSGGLTTLEALAKLHIRLAPRGYLEVGVRHGASLALASCPAVGIDPMPEINRPLGTNCRVVETTSDEFFENEVTSLLPAPLDLALIDGMHRFEFALRDFMNIEQRSHAGTLVVLDDIFPNHPAQAERERRTRVWAGDVWKLWRCLSMLRPDLLLFPLDTAPTGLLLVANLDARNRVLWNNYNPIVRQFRDDMKGPPPLEILMRSGSLTLDDSTVCEVIDAVSLARDSGIAIRQFLDEHRAGRDQ
jgi:SAM-dependent methyltransferase